MEIKNTALIISSNDNFSSKFEKLLQRNNFRVLKIKHPNQWEGKRTVSRGEIDICLIDDDYNDFNFKEFLTKLNSPHSKLFLLNVGDKKVLFRDNHILSYDLNPESESINLETFIKNINRVLERDKTQTELATTLLHDLRSPLNSIVTYMELLLNETFGSLNEGQKNFLEKAMIIGDQVFDMLEEINEVFQYDQDTYLFEKEDFALLQLIDESLLKVWVQADAKDIQIKKEIPKNLPSIHGDPFQIQRVFNNLLGNSIKYCPKNSKIIVKIAPPKDKFIEIEIMDDGGGIPESELKKIFSKNYRIENSEKLRNGHGLGLYISRLIIKAHRGKIHAINNKIGGLSLIFTLPTSK